MDEAIELANNSPFGLGSTRLDERPGPRRARRGRARLRLHVDQLAHEGLRRAALRRAEGVRLRQGARLRGARLLHRPEERGSQARMNMLWSPEGAPSEMRRFAERHGFDNYEDLQRWSVTDLEGFWRGVADFYALDLPGPVLDAPRDAGRRVVPGARRSTTPSTCSRRAMRSRSSQRPDARELHVQRPARAGRGRARASCSALGVGRGDRVVAFLPNRPETLVALPGVREPGRDLGERLARVRPAQRDRPLRAGRAEGADRGRRLRAPRQARSTAAPRWRRSAPACRRVEHVIAPELRGGRRARVRAACRSTTRSTCSSAAARPACRRRSSTATAASCSSTTRTSGSAGTSSPARGCCSRRRPPG